MLRLYCYLFSLRALLSKSSLKIDPSFSGYLQGYLSTGIQNIVTKKFGYKLVEKEIERFLELIYIQSNRRRLVDLFRFYDYSQHAVKMMSTLPVPAGGCVYLPANSGPLVSYFMAKRRGLREVFSPKEECIRYFKECTGKSFYDVISSNQLQNKFIPKIPRTKPPLLYMNAERFNKKNSFVLPRIADQKAKQRIASLYAAIYQSIHKDEYLSDFSSSANKILNLEMLLLNTRN